MQEHLIIKGAREHNLKNVSLTLPRNKMIVFTGLSGSGKSSLAFDTIFAEGQRRYVESLSSYARQFLGQMKKPDVDEIEGLSPAISIDQKAHSANPRSTVATITEIYDYLRVLYARVGKPHCPTCQAPIRKMSAEEMVESILAEAAPAYERAETAAAAGRATKKKKPAEPATTMVLAPVVRGRKGEYHQLLYDLYNQGFARVRVDGKERSLRNRLVLDRNKQHTIELIVDTFTRESVRAGGAELLTRLTEAVETALKYGNGLVGVAFGDGAERILSTEYSCPNDGFSFPEIEPRLFSFNSPYGACPECTGLGVTHIYSDEVCPACKGARLRPESLHVWLNGKSVVDFTEFTIADALAFLDALPLSERDAEISLPVKKEIEARLRFMLDVGLHYLTLGRKAGTLSGGEAQRIRLASQIGSRLVGALYVLDEPSIGLHQRDNDKLLDTLKKLRDAGNTIIVVEHDEDTILAADYLVDFGPGAGKHGGTVVAEGPVPEIFETGKHSLTVQYLTRERRIAVPARRRSTSREVIKVVGAKQNNLKGMEVEIPLKRFVCVTGVSGSGKSTLVHDILYQTLANKLNGAALTPGAHKSMLGVEHLDRVAMVDQGPIGRTPRSNPATYTGAFTHIRDLFAATEEARWRGYKAGRFSFNVPGGRCENCEGNGTIAIEMHFLPTVYVTCDVCHGRRFGHETLQVTYRGKNIHDVLTMTIEEAAAFFEDIPQIDDKLSVLNRVGLGYLELGQSATTLSGGEAQRVKLANELAKRNIGRVLYIFDEPTTGLHYDDIRRLLSVMQELVDRGNSVVVIEHNLDVIKVADHIIDLGPEGGDGGGRIVATGTPEEVAKYADTHTARYLKKVLGM